MCFCDSGPTPLQLLHLSFVKGRKLADNKEVQEESAMSKSKNHTGRNAVHKDHANRIKKASRHQTKGLKGMDPKFLRNLRFSKKGNKKVGRKE